MKSGAGTKPSKQKHILVFFTLLPAHTGLFLWHVPLYPQCTATALHCGTNHSQVFLLCLLVLYVNAVKAAVVCQIQYNR